MEQVKINYLELENVKRVKAVSFTPGGKGLTIIGGKNGQGKTSILDSIAWALGGDRYRPSDAQRNGSVIPPHLKVTLSNGIIVERSGKNSALKVIDPKGNKSGQQLLNEFISQLAIDLPQFLNSSSKEKANILLKIIGVGDELYKLENTEKQLYNERRVIGQLADQKKKYAAEMPFFGNLPSVPISAGELIMKQQAILAKNGENQRKRNNLKTLEIERNRLSEKITSLYDELKKYKSQLQQVEEDLQTAIKTVSQLTDESTKELEENIKQIDELNQKIRKNSEKEKAEIDAENYRKQYEDLTNELDEIKKQKLKLLDGALMPYPGLSVEDGELTYNGFKWDNMSSSDQLKVATAIVKQLNPKCGFVLIDKLEQMDEDTLTDFNNWLQTQNLQAIATRVSTSDECSIIIEDGYIKEKEQTYNKKWTAGTF